MTDIIVDQPNLILTVEAEDQTVLLNQTQPAILSFEVVGVQGPPGSGTGTDLGYTASTRELTSSTGADVTLPLANETTPGLARRVENGPTRYWSFDDMVNVAASNGSILDWVVITAGTGSGQTQSANHGDVISIGWVDFNLGTTSTGRTSRTLSTASIDVGDGLTTYRCAMVTYGLSTGTESYRTRFGFFDSVSIAPTDGALFFYTHGTNGGRWRCETFTGGVSTAADSGVTVAADTAYLLEVIIDPTGPSADFKINGSTVATITTNIPVDALTGAGIFAQKFAGTSATTPFKVDYQSVEQILTGRA
jgi:hypothetical protein